MQKQEKPDPMKAMFTGCCGYKFGGDCKKEEGEDERGAENRFGGGHILGVPHGNDATLTGAAPAAGWQHLRSVDAGG